MNVKAIAELSDAALAAGLSFNDPRSARPQVPVQAPEARDDAADPADDEALPAAA